MTIFTRLALGFIGAAVPILAMAAPPNVTGITAVNENGNVRVSWTQVEGDISAYRIFYSHASILGNNGLYDDFESVDSSVSMHLLRNVPPANELFVSILAVDASGEESLYFLEEARVQLEGGAGTSSASSTALQDDGMLRLLRAEAISATGVTLTFTHPVNIPQTQALDAIKIDYGSGETLQLRRFILEGNTVIVHTVAQQRGTVYRVSVGDIVTGNAATGTGTIALANDQTPVLFTGHPDGTVPAPEEETPTTPAVPEVAQLRLNAQPGENKTYTVEATWQTPAGMIAGYSIAQTTDGGITYSEPSMVDKAATAVKIPGVPAGRFGVRITVIGTNGSQSRGIMQHINLPALQDSPLPGGVIPMPGKGDGSLPDSGPALWLAVSGLGASLGAWRLRRQRTNA